MTQTYQDRPRRPSDALDFARGFLRNPAGVGSIIPSSASLERRIVRLCGAADASVVVELGPGTGGTTRALLAAMPAHARLICLELDPTFAEIAGRIPDPRLTVLCAGAADVVATLREQGLESADAVVSGIPFSAMPRPVGVDILRAVDSALGERGVFVAYQFRAHVADFASEVFGRWETREVEPANIPPMRLYRWRATR